VVAAGFVAAGAGVLVALLPPQAASSIGTIRVSRANDVARPHFRPPGFQSVRMISS
jgi:hypothetical protein